MAASMKLLTDDELGQAVFYHLKERQGLDIADLNVKAEDAVVTLKGFVKSRDEKKVAAETAMEVRGVKAITSDIAVIYVPQISDTEITGNVLRAFQSHRGIPAEQIKVMVSNGRITLEGTVSTVLERMFAEAAAKNLPRIAGVQNNILVEPQRL